MTGMEAEGEAVRRPTRSGRLTPAELKAAKRARALRRAAQAAAFKAKEANASE